MLPVWNECFIKHKMCIRDRAITFGAVSMMNMIQDKNASNEALSREFIKLMIGVWFIYNYKFFALLIIRAGTLILENVIVGVQEMCIRDSGEPGPCLGFSYLY